MKKKDTTTKSSDELQKLIAEKRASLRSFRFGIAGSKTRNVREGRNLRKDIARLLTALSIASLGVPAISPVTTTK
jgi:ribosomal protein L29